MAITPYCSKDEWAYKKAKTNWDDFTGSPVGNTHEYPSADGLDDMLEEATAFINLEIGRAEDANISSHATFLRNLCYRMVNLMIQQEQGESEGDYNMFIPKDYMYERDRRRLRQLGRELGYRKFGGTTSG